MPVDIDAGDLDQHIGLLHQVLIVAANRAGENQNHRVSLEHVLDLRTVEGVVSCQQQQHQHKSVRKFLTAHSHQSTCYTCYSALQ